MGEKKIYQNKGNQDVLNLISSTSNILDVGCGAGDNARRIKDLYPECHLYGITYSLEEASMASKYMKECWTFDLDKNLEREKPIELLSKKFDTIIFSHILEHLRWPDDTISYFTNFLEIGGSIIIAVPNVLNWRTRLLFLTGKFEYEKTGTMDDTHLRFFTYYTADKYLLSKTNNLKVIEKIVTGSVPLWKFRRYIFPKYLSNWIDKSLSKIFPNLFGSQIIIKAVKI
jgi:2-polyprenyl-3-methyl-5-hydroxy-6-metoxy-1,4-benzoquinol methylase